MKIIYESCVGCAGMWSKMAGAFRRQCEKMKGMDSVNHYDDTAESWYL